MVDMSIMDFYAGMALLYRIISLSSRIEPRNPRKR